MHNRQQVAQLTCGADAANKLLQVDNDNSVLGPVSTGKARTFAPYGHQPDATGELQSGFNGEPLDLLLMGYHLGQGKRCYSPQRRSFFSPDPTSPFDGGGINAYTYCGGDPVNNEDPTGLARAFRSSSRHVNNGEAPTGTGSVRPPSVPPRQSHSETMRLPRNDANASNQLESSTSSSMHRNAAQLNQPAAPPTAILDSLPSPFSRQSRNPVQPLAASNTRTQAHYREGLADRWNRGYLRRTAIMWANVPLYLIKKHPAMFGIGVAVIAGGIASAVLLTRKSE
jgi:RHS repeat-associated protein